MTTESNLILVKLNAIMMAQEGMQEDLQQMNRRISTVERSLNDINQRLDGFTDRFIRIERRLHLPDKKIKKNVDKVKDSDRIAT